MSFIQTHCDNYQLDSNLNPSYRRDIMQCLIECHLVATMVQVQIPLKCPALKITFMSWQTMLMPHIWFRVYGAQDLSWVLGFIRFIGLKLFWFSTLFHRYRPAFNEYILGSVSGSVERLTKFWDDMVDNPLYQRHPMRSVE